MRNLVSVIIPVFNRINLLLECIANLQRQSHTNIEIIIVDDASTEDIKKNIKLLLENDRRIKYLKNDHNMGAALSRNRGIDFAQGDFICFLDSDDKYLPQKIEIQLTKLKNSKCDFIYCGWRWVDKNNNVLKKRVPDNNGKINGMNRWGHNIIPDLLIKKECLKKIRFKNHRSFENYHFNLQLFTKYKSCFIQKPLVECLDHTGERNSDRYLNDVNVLEEILKEHYDFIKKNNKILYKFYLTIGVLNKKNKNYKKANAYFFKSIFLKIISINSLRSIWHLIKN